MTVTALALTAALTLPAAPITADQLSWMAGYWLDCEGRREASETWSDPRGGLILGSAITLEDGKVSFEQSRIAPAATDALHVAYFAGVEGAPPVVFPAIAASGTRVVFENTANDFPHRVIYERRGDVLHARIEGEMDGQPQAMDWTLQKADLNARCPI
ncbi:DUF6265 family protein [Brevundimonas sp.]|uniref:DUF6265 family protein n=1 Tax=Brevundimonas sp. TaxID=1871086 RepID=UPI003BADB654